jgi:hypothetical protein
MPQPQSDPVRGAPYSGTRARLPPVPLALSLGMVVMAIMVVGKGSPAGYRVHAFSRARVGAQAGSTLSKPFYLPSKKEGSASAEAD